MPKEDILKKYNLEELSTEDRADFIEWFTGKDGGDEDIIEARGQAAQSYPLIAFTMSQNKKIRDVIEQKKPLIPALAEFYNVDKKALKRIQGKNKFDLGIKSRHYIYDVIKLKEKHFQRLKNNLSDFNILRDYALTIYDMSIHEFLDTISLQNSNPSEYIERMKENSVYDVKDAFNFLQTSLFYPAILNKIKNHAEKNNFIAYHHNALRISRKMVIKHNNFKTILDFSERYHRNLFRWEDMFFSDSNMNHISWQPMLDRIDLGDGWEVCELHSVASLKEQGRRENHCVGGYTGSILERDDDSARLIFSLEKNEEIKSTIDILCSKNKEKTKLDIHINQNRAHSNENPSREALNFSHRLVEIIKKQPIHKLDTYLHHLGNTRKEYQKHQSENYYLSVCGYNPWDREILENVWDEFKPVLPAKLRRSSLNSFIDMMPLDEIKFEYRENGDELNPWERQENENNDRAEDNILNIEANI